ncbi:ribonuclease HII [Spiribacter vilamensis]|uniref:Ribonuclease HII n=1 Tax=Spiribacter vilamensis TaxID=531306 RepID=A0A4Q8CZU3_9GAMM|nr:ribonuclease HII [Spiribacter vilamensis]RZU98460.1 RNase HII [Spiribacter vilamensis]TVO60667.1 ribonuclease HII [Spiribacter vilamensis]
MTRDDIDPAVAGVDEVGRGPLAGPVVAAAVILDPSVDWSGLRDSKRLSAKRREQLDARIRASALGWEIAIAGVEEIDRLNIRQASLLAMQRAVEALDPRPSAIRVDGRDCPAVACPAMAVIGGDDRVPAIAAASIIAKVYRDRCALELHARFPEYGFDRHRGYPTALHRERLRRHGPCAAHRRSFAPVRAATGTYHPERPER